MCEKKTICESWMYLAGKWMLKKNTKSLRLEDIGVSINW
jgi:hypothetical protein